MLKKLLFAVFMLICSTSQAQNATALKWFNPISSTYPVLKGKYWQNADSANFYTRLPAAAEQSLAQFTWVPLRDTKFTYRAEPIIGPLKNLKTCPP